MKCLYEVLFDEYTDDEGWSGSFEEWLEMALGVEGVIVSGLDFEALRGFLADIFECFGRYGLSAGEEKMKAGRQLLEQIESILGKEGGDV